jgi:hypothetical protein
MAERGGLMTVDRTTNAPGSFIIAVIAVVALAPFAQAENVVQVRYANEINNIPGSCRVAAMGDAGVALPLDAAGAFWNAASHAYLKDYEISAEYAKLYGGLSSNACGAFHVPLQEQMSVDAFYTRFQSGDIKQWDSLAGESELYRLLHQEFRADSTYNGLFSNDQNLIILSVAKVFPLPIPRPTSYSYPLPIDLSAGVNFKGFWQTMNPSGKTRMGMNINADAGILLRISIDYDLKKKQVSREIYAGVGVKDFLGTRVVWLNSPENYQETVDMSQYFGVSYIDKTHFLAANWILSFAIKRSYDITYHGGIEAQIADMVSFRIGISNRVFTCGAGIAYKNYSFDYAFRFDELENSPMRLSLRVGF